MADNFAATADVMIQDARTLHQAKSYRNACYLAGYVVECTLKALLEQAGEAPWGHDLESLHEGVATLSLHAVVGRYGDPSKLAPSMLNQTMQYNQKKNKYEYVCDWDPKHRYDGARWSLDTISEAYLREAENCHETIDRMRLDGVL